MSISICVISPISHLHRFANFGDFDMSLAHLVLENKGDNDYARYYKQQSQQGRFVLLDNSAYELQKQGKGLSPEPVLDAAEITQPTEVIATDVLYDKDATISSTKDFLQYMKHRQLTDKYRVMAVVQGSSEGEWLDCFVRLSELPVQTIGLSKLSVPKSFLGEQDTSGCVARARLKCIKLICEHKLDKLLLKHGQVIHLLGGDNWTAWEMSQQKIYPWIRSNDSSCAVWYGLHSKVFDETGKIESLITTLPDLENKNIYTALFLDKPERQISILENIARWHVLSK